MEPIKCLYTREMEYGYVWSTNESPYSFTELHTTGKTTLDNGSIVIGRDGMYNFILATSAPTSATLYIDDYYVAFYNTIGREIQFQTVVLEGQRIKVVISEYDLKLHPYLPPHVIQFRRVNPQ